jgi:serine/threonine protein kinase
MIENGTLLQDRYLIEKKIGAGGMGAVYLAVDQRFENHVAIKETFYTDDEFSDAFEREARLLNGLHHPALPYVSDYFTDKHGHFIVMQYIEGEDLSAILKREGAFPVEDVLRWIDSLLAALDFLHSQDPPIIHRDIKPQNLKLTPRGDIILLDFGLAKPKSEDTSGVKSVFGYSRKYSPLEQIQGTGTDARSDIFSLGATAYHLLTGKPPIDVLARASEIVVENPDPLRLVSEINSEIPESVAYVLNSALALNPSARFVSAAAMRQALEYAVNPELSENNEQLPEAIVPEVPVENPVVVSPEKEDFTALDAFASEKVESEPEAVEDVKTETIETQALIDEMPSSESKALPQSTTVAEAETQISAPREKKSRNSIITAAIALLIFVGLATGYFINRAKSTNIENQNPVSQTTAEITSTGEQSDLVLEPPVQTESPEPEIIDQAKTKPVSVEKTAERVEKRESVKEPLEKTPKVEKAKSEPAQNQVRRNQSVQPIRRNEPPRRAQPRVNQTESFPDIESIFTGRPTFGDGRINRRGDGRRDQMSEEELRDSRRQRRQERRQRQNGSRFPF